MKWFVFLFFMAILTVETNSAQTTPPIEAGVSQTLARWRAANYSDVRYKLNITLEKGAPTLKGTIEISLTSKSNEIILDWRKIAGSEQLSNVSNVSINGKKLILNPRQESAPVTKPPMYDYASEHLIFNEGVVIGANVIKLDFESPIKTSGAAITRYVDKEDGAEYVYSLFVPSDASTSFPVFDQPDLKARFDLTMAVPDTWKVVSNTKVVASISTKVGQIVRFFEETKPISTYVFAFAAGDFAEFEETDKPIQDKTLKKSELEFEEAPVINTDLISSTELNKSDHKTLPDNHKEQKEQPVNKSKSKTADKTIDKSEFESIDEPIINIDSNSSSRDPNLRQSDLEPLGKKSTNDNKNTFPDGRVSASKIYVRKSQAEKFKQHAAEVFRLNREGVKFLESYFDYKFPFPKYDLVLIPEFPFGGMEHAGATFLREDRVIFPTEPTKNDYITRANVIFHEAAHQWFGDTVTMRWFDDLWLKEGFAEFMAYKTLEKVMPEYNAWKIFYERNKQLAYLTDATKGTTPIYQEIPNLSAAKSAYGNIVYRKAPSFLRQAEFYLGEDKFQSAVRAFLKKHEFANAEWTDLVKEFETASKQKGIFTNDKKGSQEINITTIGNESKTENLKNWAENWVTRRGMPVVKFSEIREYEEGEYPIDAIKSLRVEAKRDWYKSLGYEIKQKNILNEGGSWLMAFKMLVIDESGQRQIADVKFTGDKEVDGVYVEGIKQNPLKWKFVFPNYQDYGYGIFLLDERSRAYVLENIQTEKDDFLRAMMWGSLWDSVRETELNPKDYVALVIKNLNVETDESTIQTLLGRVSTAMNYYLSDVQSKELAPQIENLLLNRMAKAENVGQRITFYRALLNAASTDVTKKVLKDIFINDGKISVAVDVETKQEIDTIRLVPVSLPLKVKDKFDIVTKLITLGDKDAPRMLAELEKTEKSDEARRYAYTAQAGFPSAENAAKYFNDFTNNKDISESYIESAFVPFNSIRHSELTLPYLEKALAELPNLKRNRKIFFVNGWLAAFIGGQKSEQALAIVNKFLADNPTLDRDLRLKVLEVADGLERAVKIRAKYGK